MTEFVIYLGTKDRITIYDTGLSKRYHMIKSIPIEVLDYKDKIRLLGYKEGYGGCCGKGGVNRPIMSDVSYCRSRNIELQAFREKWTQYYEQN